ncbi:MAG: SDR family NAD(P)-dependent oxidoreductase [Gemmatimonadota bacterium]|nr:SDR family NAD(P)-dependent oxidoreductase [Gemmatimonadota bacterium]
MSDRKIDQAPAQSPIAIVGMSCLFPGASSLREYWANVRDGVDAITDVPASHWAVGDYFDADPKAPDMTYGRRGGFLDAVDFDPMGFGISPRDLEATDSTQLLGMYAAREALRDAGYGADGRDFARERTSVILGVSGTLPLVIPLGARLGHPIWRQALGESGVDPETTEDVIARIAEGYVPWQENSFPGLLANVVAGRIANRLDLHGTNCIVDAACASSLSAIHLASLELEAGRADMVLSGGLDTFNDIFMYMCFSKTPALSASGNAQPFNQDADGTILGEGVGVVALKRLADAERDGDRIYAVIKGVGSSSDGKGQAVYAPSPEGQARALRVAYRNAGVTPDTVGLVEAHGTGTIVGDATEARGLTSVYEDTGREGSWCALGSVKSMIGHTKAAAGAAGLIKAVMALHHKVLPPTIKVETPNEAVAPGETPFYVNTEKRPWLPDGDHPRRAGVSAFGFGGSNFHCVVEEYDSEATSADWDGRDQIFAFSADSREALESKLKDFDAGSTWAEIRGQAAETREAFDAAHEVRLLVVVERDGKPPADLITLALARLEEAPSAWSLPQGVFFGSGPSKGGWAACFPGQGAQYVGMFRELVCRFPVATKTLANATEATSRLVDSLYPHPAFDDDSRAEQEAELRATQTAQPAIGAVSLGALRVLEQFGITPDATCGHSYGELVALCAAGRVSPEELYELSRLRGELMAGGEGDHGSMLAVADESDQVLAFIQQHNLDLVVANHNAPRQVVLSGVTDEIDRAAEILSEEGLRAKKLPVSAAFHSGLVAEATAPFAKALEGVELAKSAVPVYANTTGTRYPRTSAAARKVLAKQMTSPVDFVQCVRAMFDDGVRTFVEVGPGRRLSGLIKEILADEEITVVAVDASSGQRPGLVDLARMLAQFAAAGHTVALDRWDEGALEAWRSEVGREKPALTVKVSGANHVTDRPKRPPRVAAPTPSPLRATVEPASTVTSDPQVLAEAMRASQASLAALVRLQEQTAEVHRQFLESQERTIQAIIQQQGLAAQIPYSPADIPAVAPAELPAAAPTESPADSPAETPVAAGVASVDDAPVGVVPDGAVGVAEALLSVVSEKTGYPEEMLDLSMGLDADLGIDSIKRVEILSALQERLPEVPAITPDHLGGIQTLGQIVDFLGGAAETSVLVKPDAPAVDSAVPEPTAAADSTTNGVVAGTANGASGATDVTEIVLGVVAEKTGYPVDMLDVSMNLDADLGIDSIKRVEILSALQEALPGAPVVPPDQLGELRTLSQIVDVLSRETDPLPAPPSREPAEHTAEGEADEVPPISGDLSVSGDLERFVPTLHPVQGTGDPIGLPAGSKIWVTKSGDVLSGQIVEELSAQGFAAEEIELGEDGHDPPDELAGLIVVVPPQVTDEDILSGFGRMRAMAPVLKRAALQGGALLCSVTALGGGFALDAPPPEDVDPTGGAWGGMLKTAAAEWTDVNCRTSDVDLSREGLAADIVRHALSSGPVEIGLGPDGPQTVVLEPQSVERVDGSFPSSDDTVLITGGARGVTAEVAVAMAEATQPRLILMGRSPEPEKEPDWLIGLNSEAEIKRAILTRAGPSVTPQEVQAKFSRIRAGREIRRTIERISRAGSEVAYRSADVRDADAIRRTLAPLVDEYGPVTGLIHGAGVLSDRNIEDKSDDDFAEVYGTKVGGLRSVLKAIGETSLKALVLFSSSTARFGRRGQVDYAAANEVLNKVAQAEAAEREGCRVVSVNWGPWDGGMVTPGLKTAFADERIEVIGMQSGAAYLLDEIAASEGPAEVLVLGPGSEIPQVGSPTVTGRNGADGSANGARSTGNGVAASSFAELPTVFERTIDMETHQFMASHVIGGRAVLPAAMTLEWLAHGALHGNPGLRFVGVDDLRVFKGVVVHPDESMRVRICVDKAQKRGDEFLVVAELCSGGSNGRSVLHARAVVVLAAQAPQASTATRPSGDLPALDQSIETIYAETLFHGPEMHGLLAVEGCGDAGLVARCRVAPPPADWMEEPVRSRWIADPLALDSGLQAMIVWTSDRVGELSLPSRFTRYRQFVPAFPEGGARIVIDVRERTNGRVVSDIDWIAEDGSLLARLEGYESVVDSSLGKAFRQNRLDESAPTKA